VRAAVLTAAALAALLAPSGAHAERARCSAPLLDPAGLGLRESGIDAARAACTASSVSAGARGLALIDVPEFYGTLSSSLFAAIRVAGARDFELEIGIRALDLRFAQNAVLTRTELSTGPFWVAGVLPLLATLGGRELVVAGSLRWDVASSESGSAVRTTALAPALLATFAPADRVRLHARAALLLWGASTPIGFERRTAVAASSDAALSVGRRFAVAAGVDAQAGWHRAGLDHLLARGAARVALGQSRLELAAAAPVAGAERTDLVLWIACSRDL
jgi:hypothetical protein